MEYVTVQDERIPALGFGTYRLRGQACERTVKEAIELGYRHIDTAEFYTNQSEIGRAIADSTVPRDELFVTTKVWRTNLRHDDVLRSATESLSKLGLDEVDLLLIHWPNKSVPVEETLGAMNQLREDGRARHIGVSNFSVAQLREAMTVSASPILANQVKYHPLHAQNDLLEACLEHDVMLTAYSPLAKGRIINNDTLARIGDRYGKTEAQVALRWLLQQDVVSAIPKASSREHLRENIEIFDFELADDEMEQIFELRGGIVDRLRSALGL